MVLSRQGWTVVLVALVAAALWRPPQLPPPATPVPTVGILDFNASHASGVVTELRRLVRDPANFRGIVPFSEADLTSPHKFSAMRVRAETVRLYLAPDAAVAAPFVIYTDTSPGPLPPPTCALLINSDRLLLSAGNREHFSGMTALCSRYGFNVTNIGRVGIATYGPVRNLETSADELVPRYRPVLTKGGALATNDGITVAVALPTGTHLSISAATVIAALRRAQNTPCAWGVNATHIRDGSTTGFTASAVPNADRVCVYFIEQ